VVTDLLFPPVWAEALWAFHVQVWLLLFFNYTVALLGQGGLLLWVQLGKVESQGFGGAPESKTRTVSIWKEPCCSVPKTGSNTTSPGC
jgi:hypothetical protein